MSWPTQDQPSALSWAPALISVFVPLSTFRSVPASIATPCCAFSVTLDPSNPDVVWVGTGENVSGRHVGWGDGVYKSLDGGQSWSQMGLEKSEHIGKIVVDPRDEKVAYVAAEGPLWSSGGERGVLKTTDGGATWTQVLEIGENTGVTDIEFDPRSPDVIYAAAYQRRRTVWAFAVY